MSYLEQLLRHHLLDWRSGWSMGTFGAIAEFHQDDGEIAVIDDRQLLTRATRRGGIRLERSMMAGLVPVAYETLSPRRHRWSQALALCLPEARARRSGRSVLTEIGPDDNAIRGIDRTGILFDMGLSLPQCDFCIRTSEPKLLVELRANLGRSVFDPANGAMPAILRTHPHRVALTNIGRVEVYQKIGGPDTGGVSPEGPHTHVLPKMLKGGRTHSANTPIPEGLLPLGALHPGNPVIDPLGRDRPFEPILHGAFREMMSRFGTAEALSGRKHVDDALDARLSPVETEAPSGRFARSAMRIALRQKAHLAAHSGNIALARLVADWQAAFEQSAAETEDDDAPGH
ncbi:hypothetical protein CO731_00641 [Aminobacter sp. MSH1]|uniref:DUF6925 family protein n=1 Tax=Aminobacter sp. MSH1 TaxID=374606 RepID=UPI000D395902|nr:hypothetical protein [Aminobacter sp. MSH1]AWC21193.1 hypothetical protein CO731_00641 [Aminobacter sp. MSH1]